MPIYEFRADNDSCDHCRDGFEVLRKLDAEPLTACPECGAPVSRKLSTFAHNYTSVRGDLSVSRVSRPTPKPPSQPAAAAPSIAHKYCSHHGKKS